MLRDEEETASRPRVQIESVTYLSTGSSLDESTVSRTTFQKTYAAIAADALENREKHKIIDGKDEDAQDLTPNLLQDFTIRKKLRNLNHHIREQSIVLAASSVSQHRLKTKNSSKSYYSLTPSASPLRFNPNFIDEFEEENEREQEHYTFPSYAKTTQVKPYISITLKRMPEILLFENKSLTAPRGTEDAQKVEEDNKIYDYITLGKGRMRRMNNSETQTADVFHKSRETNTQPVEKNSAESFVSNFAMFSSYQNKTANKSAHTLDHANRVSVTTHKKSSEDQLAEIFNSNKFKLATMVTLRILASNVFQDEQCRFRNINTQNALTKTCDFKYSLRLLFRFNPQATDRLRKSVADLSFCPGNGDILAVAYGIYSFEAMHVPDSGYCCVWNIKNPNNPERIFFYNVPVVSVQFSPFLPQLLAIGLYDGRVEVRDISTLSEEPVAVSQRTENSTCDPIAAIEWIPQMSTADVEKTEIDPLLALSQDGSVTKYRIINSPYLLAFKQIQLDRVEGTPEGLPIQRNWGLTQSNRNPQGLNMTLHPRQDDIYYVLTDEGCLHKASTNYPHQHLEVLQLHAGSVNVMSFSPWSPKLFLTAGNDWCIRIWIDGMLTPLITLKHAIGPVHYAAWSKTHSTIIVANSRESINIWDIRRSTLRPISSIMVDKSHYTQFRFSQCGRSMAIGNERGQVLMLALEDMPFPPHFQYEELELALFKAISTNPELSTELKSFGYFGYPEHRQRGRQCTS